MRKQNWLTILTISILMIVVIPSIDAYSNCSPNFDFFVKDFDNTANVIYSSVINDTSTTCQDDWICWNGYTDVTLRHPNNFINGHEEHKTLQDDNWWYYIFVKSNCTGTYKINTTFSGVGLPDCVIDTTLVFSSGTSDPTCPAPVVPVCSPPKNPKQTWIITDDQVCVNKTICRLNNINITDTGSLTLINTTLQFNLQSLYNFFITGYFTMDKDSTLLPPFASCGKITKPYPVLAKIIAAQEVGILPILYLTGVLLFVVFV